MSKIFKILIIIVVLIFILLAGLFFLGPRKDSEKVFPILSVVGEITNIAGDKVRIISKKEQNSFSQEKSFDVFVNSSTTITLFKTPLVISNENIHKPVLSDVGGISDFKVGDYVVAESPVDLRKNNSFTAVSIEVLVGPKK